MSEEIIVNDVNVAECNAYKDEHCKDKTSIMFCDTNLCSNYPYCYYKQLKRLEQENKELKKQIESQKGLITVGGKQQYEMTMAYDKCKSALEEINILAKNYCNACDEFKAKTYKNKNDCLYCNYGFIKNKINEVLK